MSIRPTAILSTIGAGIGGVLGFALGGPAAIAEGAKIGLGLGIQVGVVNKAENTVDAVGHKLEEAADKVTSRMYSAQDRLLETIEDVAYTWSTLMLSAYTMQIAMNGVNQNMNTYKTFCNSTFDNMNCVSMTLTTISLNSLVITTCACMGMKVIKILMERKTNEPRITQQQQKRVPEANECLAKST